MFKNLLKYSTRSFKRQRSYIAINITGLSIGIACSLLIALFVLYEASYDRFNIRKDRIYDVVMNFKISGQEFTEATSCNPVGPTMLRELPEIENFLRMRNVYGAKTLTYENRTFAENDIIEADSSFFDFFTVRVLKGDPRNLLNAPGKIVLSESTAKKIFGDQDPVDKIIKIGKDTSIFTVTGVMADIPGNSHFKAGAIASILSNPQLRETAWSNNWLNTYLLLKPNTDPGTVNEKLTALTVKYVGPELQQFLNVTFDEFVSKGNKYGYYLQKLTDIHLDTSVKPQFNAAMDPKLLKILGSIAILILIIATINFTNLSTAQASRRAREVGIKKIGGSSRGTLILQFLSESIIMSFISTAISLVLISAILPYFNSIFETILKLDLIAIWYLVPGLILFSALVGILAGSYPAFVLSSFNPYDVLKGSAHSIMHNSNLKRVLVVLQFTISIFLIVGTVIMYRQILFMINKDPGFVREQLFVVENQEALGTKVESFKDAVKTIPGVIAVTSSTCVPGSMNSNNGYMVEGRKEETILMWTDYVDYEFLTTYGIQLNSGRSFSKDYVADKDACLLNEAALKKFNIDPSKMRIMGYRDSGKVFYYPIIGVVRDFSFESRQNQIAPFIFRLRNNNQTYGYITVKLSPENIRGTISGIEGRWKEFVTDEPFKYFFVDEAMGKLYLKEKQNARMALTASLLAIFIAVLGLFGLTSYTVEQRTREIGIRKAMGSSVRRIYFEISREIIILISVSALISFPLIYYASGKWLENYYYRINPGFLTFLGGLLIALAIAGLTISFRILRAARINPALSLRYE